MAKSFYAQATVTLDGPVIAQIEGNHPIKMVDPARMEPQQGVSPLALLLNALAGCIGLTLAPLLDKMHLAIAGYTIKVTGELSHDRPSVYTHITVEHYFSSHPNLPGQMLPEKKIQRALAIAEKYCPVDAMLGKAAHITHVIHIVEGGE